MSNRYSPFPLARCALSIPPLLERLFQPVSAAGFVDRYFHQLPLAVPHAATELCSLATLDTLRGIAAHPESKILRSRHGQWWSEDARPTYEELIQSLNDGWTIFVRHAEKYDAGLAQLAAEFQQAFAAPIDVHFFCTPPLTQGFGWHYDVEDVFILQTQGSKKYQLRKNTVNPWPLVETTPDDLSYEAERSLPMECVLSAGDWLYIPPGYWHTTNADELSLSLSVGIMSPTAIDLLHLLRPLLSESLRWRQRLPLVGDISGLSIEQQRERLKAVFADLGSDLAKHLNGDAVIDHYLKARFAAQSV
jgi:ribosomal protein L16 Arg81 hydroxylase